MKNCIVAVLMAVLLSFNIFAQADPPKNVFAASAGYNREGVNVKLPSGEDLKYDAAKDSAGFEISYTYFPTKFVGFGIEAGAMFHNKDLSGETVPCGPGCTVTNSGISKVAVGFANYTTYLQDRKGAFQPFLKGVAGVKRGNFDGVSAGPGGSFRVGGGHSFVFGGGGGFDIKLAKKVFWRNGVTVTRGIDSETNQVDVRFTSGLAFKFG